MKIELLDFLSAYSSLVPHWESQGYFRTELLTKLGLDFIERIQRPEPLPKEGAQI